MQTLGAFALALVLIIFVHEYGHYRMALFWKVRVLQFSIGFGKPLIKWTRQQPSLSTTTDFTIGAIPLGGFVKMHGHQNEAQDALTPDAFDAKSLWARVCIVSAGPLANLLLAILLYACLNWAGSEQPRPVLSSPPPMSLADQVGLKSGDEVLRVRAAGSDWQNVESLSQLHWALLDAQSSTSLELEIQSAAKGIIRTIEIPLVSLTTLEADGDFEKLGISGPQMKAMIRAVNPSSPAALAGLRAGDEVLQVNQLQVDDAAHLIRLIRSLQGTQNWEVLRVDGERIHLRVTPITMELKGQSVPAIGAALGSAPARVWLQDGPLDGLSHALSQIWLQTRLTASAFAGMLTSPNGWRQLSGPVTIANVAGQTAEAGIRPYVAFLALVSLSIGLMNLLPIPLLDGGHLMYYLWEWVTGQKPSPIWLQRLQAFGLGCVLLLMCFAFLNDFLRWFN
jgi:regulator of sigma E protease